MSRICLGEVLEEELARPMNITQHRLAADISESWNRGDCEHYY